MVEEKIDLLCDHCSAEDWLLANGKTKRGKQAIRKGVKIGVGAQWDPDFEIEGTIDTAKRNGRKPITKESKAAK